MQGRVPLRVNAAVRQKTEPRRTGRHGLLSYPADGGTLLSGRKSMYMGNGSSARTGEDNSSAVVVCNEFRIRRCLYDHLVLKVHTTINCALRLPETGWVSLLEGASWPMPGGRRDYFGLGPKVRVHSALSPCFLQHGGSFR